MDNKELKKIDVDDILKELHQFSKTNPFEKVQNVTNYECSLPTKRDYVLQVRT